MPNLQAVIELVEEDRHVVIFRFSSELVDIPKVAVGYYVCPNCGYRVRP